MKAMSHPKSYVLSREEHDITFDIAFRIDDVPHSLFLRLPGELRNATYKFALDGAHYELDVVIGGKVCCSTAKKHGLSLIFVNR
jgi:hypothetical protein